MRAPQPRPVGRRRSGRATRGPGLTPSTASGHRCRTVARVRCGRGSAAPSRRLVAGAPMASASPAGARGSPPARSAWPLSSRFAGRIRSFTRRSRPRSRTHRGPPAPQHPDPSQGAVRAPRRGPGRDQRLRPHGLQLGPRRKPRPHLVFDVLVRYLAASAYQVRYVRNYTDVDDKIINAAGHDSLRAFVVAEHWSRVYDDITAALVVSRPTSRPGPPDTSARSRPASTEPISQGYAYPPRPATSTSTWPSSPPTAGSATAIPTISRPAPASRSARPSATPSTSRSGRAPSPANPRGTPLGPRPPRLAHRVLRHGMQVPRPHLRPPRRRPRPDLPPPRERARPVRGGHRRPFARFWMHDGFLDLDGEKMSKCLGNVVNIA